MFLQHAYTLLSKILMNILNSSLTFILPPFCIICNNPDIEVNKIVCDSCLQEIPTAEGTDSITSNLKDKFENNNCFSKAVSL